MAKLLLTTLKSAILIALTFYINITQMQTILNNFYFIYFKYICQTFAFPKLNYIHKTVSVVLLLLKSL